MESVPIAAVHSSTLRESSHTSRFNLDRFLSTSSLSRSLRGSVPTKLDALELRRSRFLEDTLYTLTASSMATTGSLSIADPSLAPGSGCAKTTETPADGFCFRGLERDDLHFGGVARLMELERWEGGMDIDEVDEVKVEEKDEQATSTLRAQAMGHEQE